MAGDLISREALIEAMRARGRELLKLGTSFEANIASVTALEYVNIAKDAPTVDAVPVVHGEWLLRHEGHGHYWECSECHENPCIYVTKNTKFCPNCGARMDLEETNADSRNP